MKETLNIFINNIKLGDVVRLSMTQSSTISQETIILLQVTTQSSMVGKTHTIKQAVKLFINDKNLTYL